MDLHFFCLYILLWNGLCMYIVPIFQVEIGKCIPAIVRIYDENDNLMEIPGTSMIDVRPEFENKIANIQMKEKSPDEEWGMGEIHFVVTGKFVFFILLLHYCNIPNSYISNTLYKGEHNFRISD